MQLTAEGKSKVMKYIDMYGTTTIKENNYLDDFIEDASQSVSEPYFGKNAYKAVAFLAMHNICTSTDIAQNGGGGERVASKTIGPVSITYKDTGRHASVYGSTQFGRLYLGLVRGCGGGISVNGLGRQ